MRKFAQSILNCLDVLERNSLIHCDLKPENILLKQVRARCLPGTVASRVSVLYGTSRADPGIKEMRGGGRMASLGTPAQWV